MYDTSIMLPKIKHILIIFGLYTCNTFQALFFN